MLKGGLQGRFTRAILRRGLWRDVNSNFTTIGLRFYEKMFLKSISSNKHAQLLVNKYGGYKFLFFLRGIWSFRLQNSRRISLHLAAITRAGSADCTRGTCFFNRIASRVAQHASFRW